MKHLIKRFHNFPFLFSLLLIIAASPCFAQWEPDVRLTFNNSISRTSNYDARCIATGPAGLVHVTWFDQRLGWYQVYYKRSTDYGVNWSPDTRLSNTNWISKHPSIAVSDSMVHVVWFDNRDLGRTNEVYYKRSTDSGLTWSPDTRLSDLPNNSLWPSVAVSDSNVYVVWEDYRAGGGNIHIYFKRSTDRGISWSPDTQLTDTLGWSLNSCVSASGPAIQVVWYDGRDGNEIYTKRSTDFGVTWSGDERLTYGPMLTNYPAVVISYSDVHVFWMGIPTGMRWDIFYKRSTDGGITWSADTNLTNDPEWSSSWPSVAVSGANVHLVWCDNEIRYKRSTDVGNSWEQTIRLTYDDSVSWNPSVAVSDTTVHVVWWDNRDGNQEIYYKRNPTGNSGVELNPEGRGQNLRVRLKAIPNPFVFFARIPSHEGERFTLYDISGRKTGTYRGDRVGEGLSAGVYFLRREGQIESPLRVVKIR